MARRMSAERIALRQLAYELYVTMPVLSVRWLSHMLGLVHPLVMQWRCAGAWHKRRRRYWSADVCRLTLIELRLITCLALSDASVRVYAADSVSGDDGATFHARQSYADRPVTYGRLMRWLGSQRLANFGALHKEPNTPRIDRSNARYYSRRAPLNKKPPL